MTSSVKEAIALLEKKVNLLVIDDDSAIRNAFPDLFASPLFNITTTESLEGAYRHIGNAPHKWHCWCVDIDLGKGQTGLRVLQKYPQFNFAVVLSGLRSMGLASDAMKSGARSVVDKDPAHFDRLYDEICKTAALGFVLEGKQSPDIETFALLQDTSVTTIDEWAQKANLPVRQLHRICEPYGKLTPHYAISLYRAIFYLLWNGDGSSENTDSPSLTFPYSNQKELYQYCVAYVVRKFPR